MKISQLPITPSTPICEQVIPTTAFRWAKSQSTTILSMPVLQQGFSIMRTENGVVVSITNEWRDVPTELVP